MMEHEHDELARRYQRAQFAAAAYMAERQAQEQPTNEAQQQEQAEETPNYGRIMAQAAGIKQSGLDPYLSQDDRLRRLMGVSR